MLALTFAKKSIGEEPRAQSTGTPLHCIMRGVSCRGPSGSAALGTTAQPRTLDRPSLPGWRLPSCVHSVPLGRQGPNKPGPHRRIWSEGHVRCKAGRGGMGLSDSIRVCGVAEAGRGKGAQESRSRRECTQCRVPRLQQEGLDCGKIGNN